MTLIGACPHFFDIGTFSLRAADVCVITCNEVIIISLHIIIIIVVRVSATGENNIIIIIIM